MEHDGTRDGFATIISAQVWDATSAVRLAAGPASPPGGPGPTVAGTAYGRWTDEFSVATPSRA